MGLPTLTLSLAAAAAVAEGRPAAKTRAQGGWSIDVYHITPPEWTSVVNGSGGDIDGTVAALMDGLNDCGQPSDLPCIFDSVVEYSKVWVDGNWTQYLNCLPPGTMSNKGQTWACNGTNPNNVSMVGAFNRSAVIPGGPGFWYSFPASGTPIHWKQQLIERRINGSCLADVWRSAAGGCIECKQDPSTDPQCINACLKNLTADQLGTSFGQAMTNKTICDDAVIPGAIGIFSGLGPWKCLDLSSGDFTNGNSLDVWPCNGLVNQQWEYYNNSIMLAGMGRTKCLDLGGGNTKDGTKLDIWDCNGLINQQWKYSNSTGQVLYAGANAKCIDVINGTNAFQQLQIWDCSLAKNSQRFKFGL